MFKKYDIMEKENKGIGGQNLHNPNDNLSEKPEKVINPKGGKKVIPGTSDRNGVNNDGIPGQEDIDDKLNDADDIDEDTTRAFS